jgi:photosystem II stability/assembly factor-like uncharacterized protein
MIRTTILSLAICSSPFVSFIVAADDDDKEPDKKNGKLNSGLFSGIKLRSIGPALMSGRISDIAIDPVEPNTWYVAAGSGNLWKTINAGTTWKPIFENYGSYSIGCVTVDPQSRHTVWVGSGEAVGGRHVGYGDGVYKSTDGGKSFKNVGLKASEHIAKILVHPSDSNVIYVASQGPLWSQGGERGLYKSTNGGGSWELVLSKGPYTGVTDVVFDPRDPDVLYAATHQRHRTVWALVNGGPESGVHKSTDAGKTWTELKGGLPGGDKGKIALAASSQQPGVVYATIELAGQSGGFWRSEDSGASWSKMSDYISGGTGAHYYQEIFADPHRFDTVYQVNVRLGRTQDGGKTWDAVESQSKHVDNHAVAFHPTDPDFLLVGCDGGLYRSFDRGKTFDFFSNLPLTQFYKVDVDYDYPFYNIVGGTQDNSTQYGPSQTGNRAGIQNSNWKVIIGGDGHDCAIDPEDPNIIYCESQQGFLRRYDRQSGESIDIRPRPERGEEDLRFNWDSPIHISPHSHTRLYFGSKKLHRSDDRGDSWKAVSPDLSRNRNRYKLKHMERVWSIDSIYDTFAMSQYGNVTSISESPVVEGLIYVGTDDGLIQVTEDGGENWRKIERIYEIPEFAFVNDIKADRHDADTVYAALDNHKFGDYKPYLIKSTDRGRTWASIAGDLPDRHLVWRLAQDHEKKELLFLGTEFGLFFTLNGGTNWLKLSGGAPTIPFRDIEIQRRENDLVGATFGRSFYVLDDYAFLRDVSEKVLADNGLFIFQPRKALQYVRARGLGSQGDGFYTADNPSQGAVFTYHVRDAMKTRKDVRKEKEGKVKKEGGDNVPPDWDKLKEEEREESPSLIFTIRDSAGSVVNRITGPAGEGIHRITWNLRSASTSNPGGDGGFVLPGNYTVSSAKRADGKTEPIGNERTFEVVPLDNGSLPSQDRKGALEFYAQVEALEESVRASNGSLGEALEQVRSMKSAVQRAQRDDLTLLDEVRALELKVMDAQESMVGDNTKSQRSEPTVPSITSRLYAAFNGRRTTYGPTKTHRADYEIALADYREVAGKVKAILETDLADLHRKLENAGVPWTPGRPIPAVE